MYIPTSTPPHLSKLAPEHNNLSDSIHDLKSMKEFLSTRNDGPSSWTSMTNHNGHSRLLILISITFIISSLSLAILISALIWVHIMRCKAKRRRVQKGEGKVKSQVAGARSATTAMSRPSINRQRSFYTSPTPTTINVPESNHVVFNSLYNSDHLYDTFEFHESYASSILGRPQSPNTMPARSESPIDHQNLCLAASSQHPVISQQYSCPAIRRINSVQQENILMCTTSATASQAPDSLTVNRLSNSTCGLNMPMQMFHAIAMTPQERRSSLETPRRSLSGRRASSVCFWVINLGLAARDPHAIQPSRNTDRQLPVDQDYEETWNPGHYWEEDADSPSCESSDQHRQPLVTERLEKDKSVTRAAIADTVLSPVHMLEESFQMQEWTPSRSEENWL